MSRHQIETALQPPRAAMVQRYDDGRMTEPLQVKGFAWLNLLRFVTEKHGAAALQQLAAAFPQYKAHFDAHAVLPIGWLPGALHLGAVGWVVKQFYGGTTDGARRFGGELAARNVSSTFASFARLEDFKVALSSTERAFGTFYSRGHMKLTLHGDVLDAHLSDFPDANPVFGNVLGAGLLAFLHAGHVEGTLLGVTTSADAIHYQVKLQAVPVSSPTPLPVASPR